MLALVAALLAASCGHDSTAPPPPFGPPSALNIVTGNGQTGTQGEVLSVPLTVQALDTAGRPVAGVLVDWHVTQDDGSLVAQRLPTVTDSTGLGLVFWQIGFQLQPREQAVVASCCGTLSATFTAEALVPFPQRIRPFGGWQTDTVGHTLAQPLVAQVVLADGTPHVGAVVGWATHSPGSNFSPPFALTDSTGRASTMWTLGTLAGQETTWVRVRGLPEVPVYATALPGPPARLAIAPASTTMADIGSEAGVQARAYDRYGNSVGRPASIISADSNIARVADSYAVSPDYVEEAHLEARRHGTTWVVALIATIRDSTPLTVLGFTAMSRGAAEICGVSLAGDIYCWGYAPFGAAGGFTPIDKTLGLGLPSANWHNCALTAAGQAYCWGRNLDGEVGDGSPNYTTDDDKFQPVAVVGGHLFSSIRAGRRHTCAIATSGDAYCWGANSGGQLGRDTLTGTCMYAVLNSCSNWPLLVAGGLNFTEVSAGFEHSCGVITGGLAYCWGFNDAGQLGNDSTVTICAAVQPPDPPRPPGPCSRVPRLVEGGHTFKSVQAGGHFSCGLAMSGDAYCWGYGLNGALGNGALLSSTVPVKVAGGLAFADVQAGWANACGLSTSDRLYCWGQYFGATPTAVLPGLQFGAVTVGGEDGSTGVGCALTTANDLYCF